MIEGNTHQSEGYSPADHKEYGFKHGDTSIIDDGQRESLRFDRNTGSLLPTSGGANTGANYTTSTPVVKPKERRLLVPPPSSVARYATTQFLDDKVSVPERQFVRYTYILVALQLTVIRAVLCESVGQ